MFSSRWLALLLTALLALAAPATAAQSPGPSPTPAASPAVRPDLPVILAEFERYAEQARQDWQIPGMAIGIVVGDELVYKRGFGMREVGSKEAVDERTIFQIGSTSKAFTSALVATVVDEGKLRWQDAVVDHMPDFQLKDPWVTRDFMVEDLMAQRSGLPPYAGDTQFFLGFDRPHVIRSLRYLQPTTRLRSAFGYQNGLFLVAAALVEQATGASWEENLKRRFFQPLGMTDTSAGLESWLNAPNRAGYHKKLRGKVTLLPRDWAHMDWVYRAGPAGGINSNVVDMANWLRMNLGRGTFQGKKLISKVNHTYLFMPRIALSHELSYALSWIVMSYNPHQMIWHNGDTQGMHTMVAMVPEDKVGIVILSNLGGTSVPDFLGRKFFDLYFGNPTQDYSRDGLAATRAAEKKEKPPVRPPNATPPLPLARYAGTYTNPIYGNVTIAVQGNGLMLTIGPRRLRMPLESWDRDMFMANWREQDAKFPARFLIDTGGTPYQLILDEFNYDGAGEFARVKP